MRRLLHTHFEFALGFAPPLVVGDGYHKMKDDEGCWLLLEAVVRTG